MANSFTLLVPLSAENRWARSWGVNDMLEVSRVSSTLALPLMGRLWVMVRILPPNSAMVLIAG